MSAVDVVVVTYNSQQQIRGCLQSLSQVEGVSAFVIDNASLDGTLDVVAGFPVTVLRRFSNDGFAVGCNQGWKVGTAPLVLFLNPDARLDELSLLRLVATLDDPSIGMVSPKVLMSDGSLARCQRRFPNLATAYSQAFFIDRLFRQASWTTTTVWDANAYERPGSPDWVPGTCLLVRRSILQQLGGLDERFFMYCEDMDLCWRTRTLGYDVRYEPAAVCTHDGGASAPRASLLAELAASRIRFAKKHYAAWKYVLHRIAVVFECATHAVVTRRGIAGRVGYLRALRLSLGRVPAHRAT